MIVAVTDLLGLRCSSSPLTEECEQAYRLGGFGKLIQRHIPNRERAVNITEVPKQAAEIEPSPLVFRLNSDRMMISRDGTLIVLQFRSAISYQNPAHLIRLMR